MNKFSKSEAIKFGWETVKKNLGYFIILMLILGVLYVIPGMIQNSLEDAKSGLLNLIFTLLILFLQLTIAIGQIRIAIGFAENKKPDYSELFSGYNQTLKYFVASIISGFAVFVGTLLLIVPGIILGIKFQFFPYFIAEKGLGPIEALQESWKITKDVKWNLFLFQILLGLINVLGALALLFGLFITVPLTMVASAYVYKKLSVHHAA